MHTRTVLLMLGAMTAMSLTAAGRIPPLPATTQSSLNRQPGPTVPGSVVFHIPASKGIYIGSPGLCVLPDGIYLVKLDEFGPKSTENDEAITRVFRSRDRGETWEPLSVVKQLFWSSLIVHRDAVYFIGTNKQYGELVVRKSTDGGATWTQATDSKNGLIREGQWHTSAMQVLERDGRLWRSIEYAQGTGWGERFRPSVMSIPVDADLLDASAWTVADPMPRDGKWLGGAFNVMLEGNLVIAPDGRMLNILRTDKESLASVAVVAPDGKSLAIDPTFDRTPIPGTDKKFLIRWDEKAKCYWALCNPLPPDFDGSDSGGTRNVLALVRSTDLKNWETRCVLLYHPQQNTHAFQYVDWLYDGDDLIVASRTAYDDEEGPRKHRGHDANLITFHRFANFRDLTPADGIAMNPAPVPPTEQTVTLGGVRMSGIGFEIGDLSDGERAFTNRDYVWADVPASLKGMRFTRLPGGKATPLTITASKPTEIVIATAEPKSLDLAGFEERKGLSFHYTDGNRTPMIIYHRTLAAGETLTLPTGNWSGCLLLVRP